MSDRERNPIGTPDQCAAAQGLITPELLAQADEIRANWWDYHPRASLPDDRSLVAYSDGIWIVEAGCVLNELVRFARVADSWPCRLDCGGIRITSNGYGQIPISESGRHSALQLVADPGDTAIAEVPAPARGWNHASLAVALEAQRGAVAGASGVRAMLGLEELGRSEPTWALRP